MPRVGRRRREAKVPVEPDGLVVLGVNGKCAHADHVGDLERAPERVKQQTGTNVVALRLAVDGKASEYEKRDRMAGHALHDAFGSFRVLNLSGDDGVEADNLIVADGDIRL